VIRRATVVLVLDCILAAIASAQSSMEDRRSAQETKARGYWVDPTTRLMWARKDNGKDVNWQKAMKYCSDLRFAGYSDWRLATIHELQGIYDRDGARALGHTVLGDCPGSVIIAWSVKGNLSLTGCAWSSSRTLDGRGRPSGRAAWLFDPFGGRPENEPLGYYHGLRAPCIRRSGE